MHSKATLQDERGPPPYFAGRKAELAAMRKRLDIALREPDSATNGLLLITGIPGIGKTHLAKHFILGQAENKQVKSLVIDTDALASPEGLIGLIGEALGGKDRFVKAAGVDDKLSGARVGIAGVSGGFTLDARRPDLKFAHMIRATKSLRVWRNKALVLVVDEVHNVDAESASQLRTLHTGEHGCPIFPLAAGLQHSQSVLGKHGVSRLSCCELGLLSRDESVEAVHRGLRNLGVDVDEDTAGKLAEAAMCFPQHIHAYIEAALDVHERRGEVDSTPALAETLEIGREARQRYYVGRINAIGGEANRLYPLVEHMDDERVASLTRAEAESIVGADTVAASIEHGVLTRGRHGLLSFGIPSFRAYMTCEAAAYRALAKPAPRRAPAH